MSDIDKSKQSGFFYGWWVVISCCLFLALYVGFTIYGFSIFVKPIAKELGFGRGPLMLGFMLFMTLGGVVATFVGRLIDRQGAPKIMAIGGGLMGISFIILAYMNALWMYFFANFILAFGAACMGQVPCSTVIAQWFTKKRGTALGITTAGIGLGGLISAPVIGGWMIPTYGWRMSYIILAVIIMAIIIPLSILVIKTRPSEMGLYPDGEAAPATSNPGGPQAQAKALPGVPLKEARKTLAFWLLGAAYFTFSVAQLGVMQNQVPHLTDIGFNVALAAGALGVVGLMSAVGKFVFGWMCDKMSFKIVSLIGFGLQLVGIVIFSFLTGQSPIVSLYVYAVIFGLGAGCWLPLLGVSIGKYFGVAHFGAIFSVVALMQIFGASCGPVLGGALFDALGSYARAFMIFAVFAIVSVVCIALLPKPKSGW